MAKAVSYVCAAFGAVLALFSLALLSVDLSPPPASSEGSAAAPMGSGAMFDAIAHRYDVTNKASLKVFHIHIYSACSGQTRLFTLMPKTLT